MKSSVWIPVALLVILLSVPSHAEDGCGFQVSCGNIESMFVGIGPDLETMKLEKSKRRFVVVCGVALTPDVGRALEQVKALCPGKEVHIYADDQLITEDSTSAHSSPPAFSFSGDTWAEVRAKALAICPDKVPQDVPQQVLDHRPQQP